MKTSTTDSSPARASASGTTCRRNGTDEDLNAASASSVGRELAPRLSDVGREEGTHSVYVVRLERDVLAKKKFVSANPEWRGSGLCLYIGLTGLAPTDRFANHKSGYKASRWVRDYGIELLTRYYAPLNKMSYSRADEVEEILGEFLRKKGHTVWYN